MEAKIKTIKYHTWHRIPNGTLTISQFNTTNEGQEVSPLQGSNEQTRKHRNNTNDPSKKYCLGTVSRMLKPASLVINFQNALPSDFDLLRIKVLTFCISSKLTKVSIIFQNINKTGFHPFFRKNIFFWGA